MERMCAPGAPACGTTTRKARATAKTTAKAEADRSHPSEQVRSPGTPACGMTNKKAKAYRMFCISCVVKATVLRYFSGGTRSFRPWIIESVEGSASSARKR